MFSCEYCEIVKKTYFEEYRESLLHLNRVSNDTIVINIVEATVKKYIFAG